MQQTPIPAHTLLSSLTPSTDQDKTGVAIACSETVRLHIRLNDLDCVEDSKD